MPYWEFLSFIFLLLENWISFFLKLIIRFTVINNQKHKDESINKLTQHRRTQDIDDYLYSWTAVLMSRPLFWRLQFIVLFYSWWQNKPWSLRMFWGTKGKLSCLVDSLEAAESPVSAPCWCAERVLNVLFLCGSIDL